MVKEITWQEAISQVLTEQKRPMHCDEIAEFILSQELKSTVGKTPNATVAGIISRMRSSGAGHLFDVGFFRAELRKRWDQYREFIRRC